MRGGAGRRRAWRLEALGEPAPLEVRPPTTAFVGRERELAQLRDALAAARREQAVRLLAVVGPPGIGKSRLAHEASADLDALVVSGRCLSYGEGLAYRPLAEIVGQLGDVEPLLAGDEQADVIHRRVLAATGQSDEPAKAEETAWAVRRLFEAAARERPLVVVIDDVHWAEPALLDLVDYLIAFSSGAAILLVCLGRPELLERRPSWAAPQRSAAVLGLDALDEIDALALVARLGAQGLAARRMVERADGNPLFLEQLVAIGAEGELPPTVEAVLAARLDQLGAGRARAARARRGRGAAASAAARSRRSGDDDLTAPLTALVRRQLIHPERPTRATTASASPTRCSARSPTAACPSAAARTSTSGWPAGCRARPTPRTRSSATTSSAPAPTAPSSGSRARRRSSPRRCSGSRAPPGARCGAATRRPARPCSSAPSR